MRTDILLFHEHWRVVDHTAFTVLAVITLVTSHSLGVVLVFTLVRGQLLCHKSSLAGDQHRQLTI